MLRLLTGLTVVMAMMTLSVGAVDGALQPAAEWQSPPDDILEVLHAPQLPWAWTAPTGEHLLLADPVTYPPLAELAAPMHKLAGMRVDPKVKGIHGRHGATSPRVVRLEGGAKTPLDLPGEAEVHDVAWTADGQRYALTIRHPDHMGLWVGSVKGDLTEIKGLGHRRPLAARPEAAPSPPHPEAWTTAPATGHPGGARDP